MDKSWILFNVIFFSLIYRFYGYWCFIAAVTGSLIAEMLFL